MDEIDITETPEDRLALLLVRAADESSPEALDAFYRELLTMTLMVPERAQEQELAHQPRYPDAFRNILGIQKKDQVFVPFFSSEERVREWSGHELRMRQMTLSELIALLPEGWWLILNPASEGEKDFSPWEIELLRGGVDNIPAIIDEILVEDVIEDIETNPLADGEFGELKRKLIELAEKTTEVEKLFMMREKGKTLSDREISSVMLGVLISSRDVQRREEIQEAFSNVGALVLIGDEKLKVRVGDSLEGNLMLGVFQGQEPIYAKPSRSFFSKLFSR